MLCRVPASKAGEAFPAAGVVNISAALPPTTGLFGIAKRKDTSIIFDMGSKKQRPVLILGDEGCGKTDLVRLLASSAMARSTSSDVGVMVITGKVDEWAPFMEAPHFYGAYVPGQPALAGEIDELARVGLRRYDVGRVDDYASSMLIIIDDLRHLTRADTMRQFMLSWILKYGYQVGFYVVATMRIADVTKVGHIIELFPERILGHMEPDNRQYRLAKADGLEPQLLKPKKEFALCLGDERWERFRLPIDAGV